MRTIEVTDAKESLAHYAREIGQETLIVTEGGAPVAALIPIEEADLDSVALGTNPKFLALLEWSRAQYRAGQSVSSEELRQESGTSGDETQAPSQPPTPGDESPEELRQRAFARMMEGIHLGGPPYPKREELYDRVHRLADRLDKEKVDSDTLSSGGGS